MNWKHILAGICGFAFGFWLCMPRDVVLLPRYEVLVLDENGIAFPSAQVEQVRRDFAVSGLTSSSLATADSYGRAAFPAVRAHTNPLLRLIVCGRQIAAHGIRTPCGFHQQITAEVPGYTEASRSETTPPLKSRGRLLRLTLKTEKLTPQN
jgi:hypothetical protein